jgi:hypothetical protein
LGYDLMAFRRNNARRRRLAMDPVAPVGVEACVVSDSSCESPTADRLLKAQSRHYAFGANRRCQPKTTDLIPKRICSYLLVVLGLLAVLWLMTFLARQSSQWSAYLGESGTRLLAIRGQGSLANWFSSFLLIITGVASLQIYALRKHRCDDYRGTYRLWIWMAALLILASINCVSDLTGVVGNLVSGMLGGEFANRAWIPLSLQLVALSGLTIRGIYEVRASLGSLVLVIFVWSAYVAAIVLQYPAARESLADMGPNTMLGNCLLFGTTGLFLAHITYARYVFLDAHGLIKQRMNLKKSPAIEKSSEPDRVALEPRSSGVPDAKSRKKTKDPVPKIAPLARQQQVVKLSKEKEKRKNEQTLSPASTASKKVKPGSARDKSPSEVLKELAEASRAKEKRRLAELQAAETRQATEVPEMLESVKMSKSQRRKQRKLDKQQRRAA